MAARVMALFGIKSTSSTTRPSVSKLSDEEVRDKVRILYQSIQLLMQDRIPEMAPETRAAEMGIMHTAYGDCLQLLKQHANEVGSATEVGSETQNITTLTQSVRQALLTQSACTSHTSDHTNKLLAYKCIALTVLPQLIAERRSILMELQTMQQNNAPRYTDVMRTLYYDPSTMSVSEAAAAALIAPLIQHAPLHIGSTQLDERSWLDVEPDQTNTELQTKTWLTIEEKQSNAAARQHEQKGAIKAAVPLNEPLERNSVAEAAEDAALRELSGDDLAYITRLPADQREGATRLMQWEIPEPLASRIEGSSHIT